MNKFPLCILYIFCNNCPFPTKYYIRLISSCLSLTATDSEGFTHLQLSFSSRSLPEITALHFETGICFTEIQHDTKEAFNICQIWL